MQSGIALLLCLLHAASLHAAVENTLETCDNDKCFKNLLKTRPNLLVLFSRSDAEAKETIRLMKEVNLAVKGTATLAYINCDTGKKLCKKLKINPEPTELKHYNQGEFNKDYDRKLVKKSIVNFLADPTGDLPWEEEETAKDVVHIKSEARLNKLLKTAKVGVLVMFYAPWCGYCKKLKPDYSSAATELKSRAIMAAMNVDNAESNGVKRTYNITGFPTLIYFKDGQEQFPYGSEHNKQALVDWMLNPEPAKAKEPEKSWADEEDVHVTFLQTDNFDEFLEKHDNVLVMFYAPWCGHCKNMKPVLNSVSKRLAEIGSNTVIAFVNAQEETVLAERFKVKGFPTIKLFKAGKFAWDYNERVEDKIFEYLQDPSEPPAAPPAEPEWADDKSSYVVHADADTFAPLIKTKKHTLAFFYAPWCGHCKNAKPHFTQAAEKFSDDLRVSFVAVDCTKHNPLCEQYGVKGFPTIIYFNYGKNPQPYEGGREYKDFVKFMSNPSDPNAGKVDPRDDWLDIVGNEHVALLDDTSFDAFIQEKPKVLVMFYAPWCGHCKAMKPDYAQAASEMKSFMPGRYLAAVDATKTTLLNQRFELKGFPTLKYFENGEFKFDYPFVRSKEAIMGFMQNPVASAPTTGKKQEL